MDFISNLLGLTKLDKLKREQLIEQDRADKNLSRLENECPKTVASLLLSMRGMSRLDQRDVVDAKLADKCSAVEKEITNSSEIYRKINHICYTQQTAHDKCCKLKKEFTGQLHVR